MSKADQVALLARNLVACEKEYKQLLQTIGALKQKLRQEGFDTFGTLETGYRIVAFPDVVGKLNEVTVGEVLEDRAAPARYVQSEDA